MTRKPEDFPFTPGPWQVSTGFVFANTPNGNRVICSMARNDSAMNYAAQAGSTEDAKNARLIAAAPEMLGALEAITRNCETFKTADNVARRLFSIADFAIRKARGSK